MIGFETYIDAVSELELAALAMERGGSASTCRAASPARAAQRIEEAKRSNAKPRACSLAKNK